MKSLIAVYLRVNEVTNRCVLKSELIHEVTNSCVLMNEVTNSYALINE